MNNNQQDMERKRAVYESMKKSTIVAFFLWLFFDSLGVHRFYLGRPVSGLLLLTSIIFYGIPIFGLIKIKDFPGYILLAMLLPTLWIIVDLFLLRSMKTKYNFRLHNNIINY